VAARTRTVCGVGKKVAADKAGAAVTDRGFINVDIQMRTNVPHIFAIGDVVGQPMLAHKAMHEAHMAAEVMAGELPQHQQEFLAHAGRHTKKGRKLRPSEQVLVLPYLGMMTESITWITPLSATMSVAVTLALSTFTPPLVETVISEPCTVLTLPALTSAAITLPGTTW